MNLRLVQLLVPGEARDRVMEILRNEGRVPQWEGELSDGRVLIQTIVPATGNEPVLDQLQDTLGSFEGFRILLLPIEATLPRFEPAEAADRAPSSPEGLADEQEEVGSKRVPARINREELYADMAEGSRASPYYLAMVALSTVVACAGLYMGDVAVIIGAMVIAPLIGPNLGVSLATTLGDLKLGRSALLASFAGVTLAFAVALLGGFLVEIDPAATEIAGRTELTWGHLTLALAAGAAGAIALAQGVGAGLVGVMVAVALLPPLAAAGLLVGSGHMASGMGALLLTAGNVVCVNLAATTAFLVQGVRPNTWWEGDRRKRAIWVAGLLWGGLLLALAGVVALA